MAGLSVLAHTHTPPANQTSSWAEETTTPMIIPLSPQWDENTPALPTHHSGISAHPLVGRRPVSHAEDSLLGSHAAWEKVVSRVIHIFHRVVSGVYFSSEFWGQV